jgi:predicted DNA-binding transcriptional regulator AlpA
LATPKQGVANVHRIISKKEFAERMGRSVRHLERMIAVGEGPIIKLGARAVGIAEDDGEAWLASRRVTPPGWVDASAAA